MENKRKKIPGIAKKHIAQLMVQLADLLEAGCTLNRSLEAIVRQSGDIPTGRLAESLRRDISNGMSLAAAMENTGGVFSSLDVSMIRAAEEGGFLQHTLTSLASHMASQSDTVKQIKARLAYPIMLAVTVVVSIVFLLGYVVPKFTAVYRQTSQALPGPTQTLLSISAFFETGWIFIVIAIVLIFLAVRGLLRIERFRMAWDSLVLRIPVYGSTMKCWQMYRFAGTMSLLVTGGVSALQAIKLSVGVVGNASVRRDIGLIAQSVERGQRISNAMSNSQFFDDTTLEMIFVSESTGRLAQVFSRLASQHQRDFKARVDLMLSLLEPVIIVIMSIIVGLTVTAMLLPVFSMDTLLE